jgi:hypothetical protein
MKILCLIFAFSTVLHSNGQDYQPDPPPDEAVVSVLHEHSGATQLGTTVYSVRWEQLTRSSKWQPETDAFPANLQQLAGKALSTAFTGTTDPLDPIINIIHSELKVRFEIARLVSLGQQPVGSNRAPSELKNLWVVSCEVSRNLEYTGPPVKLPLSYTWQCIPMTFDGSIATKHTNVAWRYSDGRTLIAGDPTFSRFIVDKAFFHTDTVPSSGPDAPHRLLTNSVFTVPTVQWNPATEPFLLDINEMVTRTKNHLMEELKAPARLSLLQISIDEFYPEVAVKHENLAKEANQHHWSLTFDFVDEKGGLYEACMLLDGHIYASILPLR